MAVIDSYFWGFSKKIIDIATANKKNIKHIKLSFTQKYFPVFSANDNRNMLLPLMYFDTVSPESDLYFANTKSVVEYKNYGGREYSKTSKEISILDEFKKANFNFKKEPDFKVNYYRALPVEIIISNLLQALDRDYKGDVYYASMNYSGYSTVSESIYEFKLAIPEENLGKKDYDKIVDQIKNIIKDIPDEIITITDFQLKTASPRKKVATEDKYEQDCLLDGNGIRIQRGDIVIFHTYSGHISYGRVLSNTTKCVKIDSISTLVNASLVYVVRSGNEEKLGDIPWNKGPCDLLDKSESYYL